MSSCYHVLRSPCGGTGGRRPSGHARMRARTNSRNRTSEPKFGVIVVVTAPFLLLIFFLPGLQKRLWWLQEALPPIPAGQRSLGGLGQNQPASRGRGKLTRWHWVFKSWPVTSFLSGWSQQVSKVTMSCSLARVHNGEQRLDISTLETSCDIFSVKTRTWPGQLAFFEGGGCGQNHQVKADIDVLYWLSSGYTKQREHNQFCCFVNVTVGDVTPSWWVEPQKIKNPLGCDWAHICTM